MILCASPAYLSSRGRPEHPRDLITHDCITFLGLTIPNEWLFKADKKGRMFPVRLRLVTSTAESAVEAALSGSGITRLLCYQASHKVVTGELDTLLTDYEPEPCPINFVYPSSRMMPAKLSAFLEFATPKLRDRLIELS